MVSIPPIFTSDSNTKWSHLYILAQIKLPRPLGGMLSPPWSSNSRFPWFSKSICFFCHENCMEARMVSILPIVFLAQGNTKSSHLCIGLVKISTNTRRNDIASPVIQFEISLAFSGKFIFLSRENYMEECVVAIPPIFTSDSKAEELAHLYIRLVELATTTTRRNVVNSLVTQLTIYLG